MVVSCVRKSYINNRINQWFTEGEFDEKDLTTISGEEDFTIDG